MRVVGSAHSRERSERHIFLQCPECLKPVCATLHLYNDHEAVFLTEKDENGKEVGYSGFREQGSPINNGWRLQRSWPEPAGPQVPEHLPRAVHKAFAGAEKTFRTRGLEEQTAAAYGRALDIGTKLIAADEPEPERFNKKMIAQRLDMLAEAHRIPPDLKDWARHIQTIRNPAMHDVQDMERTELEALRGLTEMVLRYLFTLPTMVAERKCAALAGLTEPPPSGEQEITGAAG